MLRIPGLRFRAVCDIWTEYNQRRVVNTLKRFKHEVNGYEDYREMLDKEKELDAVIIATPDFWHAQHTIDCLKAGKHVYCEKEMSNTLEGARSMVLAARETGKLLQIGHQRRSNPRYIHCYEKLLTRGEAARPDRDRQRAVEPRAWRPTSARPIATRSRTARLKQYGFKDMHQFRNWRWYKGMGGGPIVDLGSHQIDIYSWFLGANPSHVMASGGLLYHDPKTHEWYDTVMVVYDYDTPLGPAKAYYQTQTTNGSQGYFENFMGDQGTLLISESEVNYAGLALPRPERARLGRVGPEGLRERAQGAGGRRRRATPARLPTCASRWRPTSTRCRSRCATPTTSRTCRTSSTPCAARRSSIARPRSATRRAVSVLKVNEAIEAKSRLSFKPEDFRDLGASGRTMDETDEALPRADDRDHGAAGPRRVALPLRGPRQADGALVVGRGLPEAGARAVCRACSGGWPASRTCSPTPTSSRCGGSRSSGPA